ncbi:LD-carboxypeptidase [Kitasatospora sp. MMS16-BH015]|uniref:S66 family peptidase n=1 Tax=Kitasatospora sp. MMS16-BH015 TaxID=2018025 RepID=UPI000CA0AB29|nr:S66 peptidase family protein [Kitasatospora sp. MMS16-BH015]AUG81087.1 LD-carboxypeptidase [Kitasatospora sp. MMS16-BH015]
MTERSRTVPPKPVPGDRVALLSPAAGLPAVYPRPFEEGVRRLIEDFGLKPVEYPTTRTMGATPQERAADLHAAFADPEIKAIIASIGGDDQITVLPYLDAELIRANPKPFFGYSDNTNLLMYLAELGIVGYHGACVMVELGRPGAVHPLTEESFRAALFTTGEYELTPAAEFHDVERDWADPATFDSEPEMEAGQGWHWHRPDRVVEGAAWGGCLEIVTDLLIAGRAVRPVEEFEGGVLFLETSEEMPSARRVYRSLRAMGERGLLRRFPALVMGRARAWSFEQPLDEAGRAAFRADQRAAVLRALAEYAPDTMAVFDVDLGHTDPQLVIPYGGLVRVDGPARRITVRY